MKTDEANTTETPEVPVVPEADEEAALVAGAPEEDDTGEERDRDALEAANDSDEEEAAIVKETGLTPLTAILEKCKDCSCGQRRERILCKVKGCALWPFRKGYKPVKATRKPMSEEARAAARVRFDAMLARRKAEREAKGATATKK